MRIAVVGSSLVGLVGAACFAELGHEVVCVDSDERRIALLQRSDIHIHEKFLPELLVRHSASRLTFTTSLRAAVRDSDVVFITVGAQPTNDGVVDLSLVEGVSCQIAEALNGYKVIVEKSTAPVYTSDWIRRVMLRSGAPAGGFDVVSNPEFLREGTAVTDFLYPDRIVVGADSERCAAILKQIYTPLLQGTYSSGAGAVPAPDGARIPATLIVTGSKSAELIKHASNAFLAMKISFINAVANVCEAVGADIEEVRRGMGSDARIGDRFLNPGIGYGGSCFPNDLLAFRTVARNCGSKFGLLDEVICINDEQREHFIRKVRGALWTLRRKRLAVLGLAFKGGTDDIRESAAIEVVSALVDEGCAITAYDPAAMDRARPFLPATVRYAADIYAACQNADALLILTDWEEFAGLDLKRVRVLLRSPIIIDGRNLYEPGLMARHGFHYVSIGRADAVPDWMNAGATRHVA
jgi:UDPglucose 6-dehydrogenase